MPLLCKACLTLFILHLYYSRTAMGKIHRVPRFIHDDSDEIKAVRVMPISWGGDHRAVDGATIARFSNLWKSYCENPASMMFSMR